jgi:hypothetical protein
MSVFNNFFNISASTPDYVDQLEDYINNITDITRGAFKRRSKTYDTTSASFYKKVIQLQDAYVEAQQQFIKMKIEGQQIKKDRAARIVVYIYICNFKRLFPVGRSTDRK